MRYDWFYTLITRYIDSLEKNNGMLIPVDFFLRISVGNGGMGYEFNNLTDAKSVGNGWLGVAGNMIDTVLWIIS